MAQPLRFSGGRNVAMKIPPDAYAATVAFYRDMLGLPVEVRAPDTAVVDFGHYRLWLDEVATVSQAEIWLEVVADDTSAAASHLAGAGTVRCDAIEPLPDNLDAFWIKSPASIVHLVAGGDETE